MSSLRREYILGARDDTGKATSSAKKNFKAVDETVEGLKRTLTGLIGAGVFTAMMTQAIAAGAAIDDMNKRLGIGHEALSQYEFVAEQTGVAFNTLTMALQRSTRRIAEAAQGTGEAKDALLELGLSAEKLNQLKPEEQFEILADALHGVELQSDRVRLAMKLFDSEGVSLLQMFENGSAGIRSLREEADAMGLTLDKMSAQSLAAADDAINKIKMSSKATARTLAVELAPVLVELADWFQNHLPTAIGFLGRAWQGVQVLMLKGLEIWATAVGKYAGLLSILPGKVGDMFANMEAKMLEFADVVSERHDAILFDKGEKLAEFRVGQEQAEAAHQARLSEIILTETERRTTAQARAEEKAAMQRVKAEQWFAQTKMSLDRQAWGQAASLLQVFAGENKTAARIVIGIQSALAIAQIKFNTAVAVMRAYAELGPIAGPPAAAAIQTKGAIAMALVGATGIAQLSQLNASPGGAGLGTPANPVHTESLRADSGFGGNTPAMDRSGRTLNIILHGALIGGQAALEYIAEALRQADDLDMITIQTPAGRAVIR